MNTIDVRHDPSTVCWVSGLSLYAPSDPHTQLNTNGVCHMRSGAASVNLIRAIVKSCREGTSVKIDMKIIFVSDKASRDSESPKPFHDLDLLGTSLLRDSLPTNPVGPFFKPQEKISLNQMKQNAFKGPNEKASGEKDLDAFLLAAPSKHSASHFRGTEQLPSEDASILDSGGVLEASLSQPEAAQESKAKDAPNVQLCEVKPMNNINVNIEDIKPGKNLTERFKKPFPRTRCKRQLDKIGSLQALIRH